MADSVNGDSARRLRPSRHEGRVMEALRARQPATVQTIYSLLRSQGDFPGLATVYRILHDLEARGIVRGFSFSAGTSYLLETSDTRSTCAVCIECGNVRALPRIDQRTLRGDFLDETREVEIRGRCRDCAASE
ncbi:hypothetical protein F1C58_04060 [Glaciihabitans sp. INWT7]|uniref:Fur family transcriptional regulator n=1 Tax=Glaciihabitans sp. INWT7 TaxID=2596912 RepID=UPI001860DBF8|nr:hypothetical protein F1C58_04060 [Glaciihabitans sp. INWT7]